jgi:hypothetical protein
MRLLVCGSRTWTDYRFLRREIEYVVCNEFEAEPFTLIEGDAPGADRMAGHLARRHGWDLEVYPADWQQDGRAQDHGATPPCSARADRTWCWCSWTSHSTRAGALLTWCAAPAR